MNNPTFGSNPLVLEFFSSATVYMQALTQGTFDQAADPKCGQRSFSFSLDPSTTLYPGVSITDNDTISKNIVIIPQDKSEIDEIFYITIEASLELYPEVDPSSSDLEV